MSSKSSRGPATKVKLAPQPEPREIDVITKEYAELTQRAGHTQYQVHVLTKELENINARLININNEAAARNEINKKTAESSTEETKA